MYSYLVLVKNLGSRHYYVNELKMTSVLLLSYIFIYYFEITPAGSKVD